MPTVERPGGILIHWEGQGDGPVVLVAHHTLWSYPALYAPLMADLARDHHAVLYDPRGCGRSSRVGPYEVETDAHDLETVVAAAGGGAVAIAVGDGLNRSARAAAARPDLIEHVVAIAPSPAALLPRRELEGSDVVGASQSVIDMLLQMLSTDPRSASRTMIAAVNPDLDEEQLRERVDTVMDYLTPDGAAKRANAWLEDDVRDQVRSLGDRLSNLYGGPDPLFEGALATRFAELFPDAHLEEVADGPVSRPDLTAAHVRRLTGGQAGQ
jgi:pimeloyl-ACP methyl ester carboxylesterase